MGSDYLTSPFDDLLKPVDDHLIVHNELMSPLILGNRISIHSSEKGIPDLDSIKIAIIGIPEERNSVDYLGDNLNLNEIRKSLYNLYPGNWSSKIADLGNLILGGSADETYGRVISLLTVEDLHAPQEGGQGQPISGQFTKFDFETGSETNSETDWDIAFRGTSIIVNGGISLGTNDEPERTGDAGVYIFNGTMAEMVVVDTSLITQDSSEGYAIASGSGNGWYTYTGPPTYLISPTPGKILVFRTGDGKYAKMEILSYYLGAPENPDAFSDPSRYYTFNYVYQPNEGVTDFE